MPRKLSHITLLVKNQDEALKFFTEKMGFVKHTDASFGPDRWLTVCLPDERDFEIALMQAKTAEEIALVGKQVPNCAFLAINTDNCKRDYEAMKKAGVEFMSEPVQEPWGLGTVFKDLYGNIWYLNQPA